MSGPASVIVVGILVELLSRPHPDMLVQYGAVHRIQELQILEIAVVLQDGKALHQNVCSSRKGDKDTKRTENLQRALAPGEIQHALRANGEADM